MRSRRLESIVRKELRQLRRDPRLVVLLLAAPLIQLVLFGYAISTDLKGARLGVVIEDPSPEARGLVRAIMTTGVFELARESARPADVRRWLDRGEVDVALHIPPGFARAAGDGGRPPGPGSAPPVVQVVSDGSDPNTATLAYQYLSRAALAWAAELRAERNRPAFPAHTSGSTRAPEGGGTSPDSTSYPLNAVSFRQVRVESRFWYNPDLRSVHFQIPGVLALIAMALTLTPTTIMVVKERELGTLEQLSVTPITGPELLAGKSVPTALMGIAMTVLTVLVAIFWFGVPLRGSVVCLSVCTLLFLLNTLGLGLLLATVSRTQLQAQLIASFVTTPMIMLSGFLFPIANMPAWVQLLTYALPMRYYMDVVRGVFLKGQGFVELWPQALAIALLGGLLYAGGIFSFRKREG